MNFNKLYATFCGISSITIFAMYFTKYYDVLSHFSATLQRVVIGVSVLGFIAAIFWLVKNGKELLSKNYVYTTLILSFIASISMWFNWFLYTHI